MYHEISRKSARERKGDWTFQMILINYLVHAAPEGQSSDVTESFPTSAVFSTLLHQIFKGYLAFILERNGENSTGRDCLHFLVICVPFKTEKRFLLVAEESNTAAVVLCTELWSGLGYQQGVLFYV